MQEVDSQGKKLSAHERKAFKVFFCERLASCKLIQIQLFHAVVAHEAATGESSPFNS